MEKRWSILVSVVFLVGCGSIPTPSVPSFELPLPKMGNPLAAFQMVPEKEPVLPNDAAVPTEYGQVEREVPQLREQLIYGSPKARISACNRLGELAVSKGSKDSVELLDNVWANDPNHDVRMAAAKGLSQSRLATTAHGGTGEPISDTRLSFLPKFWK